MSDEPCRNCGRNLHFRARVEDALPYRVCAVCMAAVMEGLDLKIEDLRKAATEAMAAGYAQGVEATEARAIKRISELESAVATWQASSALLKERLDVHSQIQAEVFAWRNIWKGRADASRRVVAASMKLSMVMGTVECPVRPQQCEAFTELEMALADFAAAKTDNWMGG